MQWAHLDIEDTGPPEERVSSIYSIEEFIAAVANVSGGSYATSKQAFKAIAAAYVQHANTIYALDTPDEVTIPRSLDRLRIEIEETTQKIGSIKNAHKRPRQRRYPGSEPITQRRRSRKPGRSDSTRNHR